MKHLLVVAALALATPAAAVAADLSILKAQPRVAAYPTSACGTYFGIAGGGSAGAVTDGPPGTVSTGGQIGGVFGYACPTAALPWFFEGIAQWKNIGTSNSGFNFNAPFHGEVRVGVQTDLLQLVPQIIPGTGAIGSLPAPTPPVLPPGASINGVPVNYFYGAANFDDVSSQFGLAAFRGWLISPEIGLGLLTPVKLANGKPVVIDAWAGMEMQTNSFCLGQFACPKLGARWTANLALKL